jgi:hypothetical protein
VIPGVLRLGSSGSFHFSELEMAALLCLCLTLSYKLLPTSPCSVGRAKLRLQSGTWILRSMHAVVVDQRSIIDLAKAVLSENRCEWEGCQLVFNCWAQLQKVRNLSFLSITVNLVVSFGRHALTFSSCHTSKMQFLFICMPPTVCVCGIHIVFKHVAHVQVGQRRHD